MKIQKLPAEFEAARPVLQTIEAAGFEAYFVGGSVRDTILGLPIHDVDIASSAYPAEIKALFERTVDTGIEHGTVMVLDHGNGYEVTTFRTESGYQDYRRPDKVTFIRSLTEDLKRRDFTINALAMKEDGKVIDLFDGVTDLKNHLIRAVGDANVRFNEDALRMMRAVRFASKLNFSIDPDTMRAITKHSYLLEKIAVERIYTEFVKMMMGYQPQLGLRDMLNTNMVDYVPVLNNYLPAIESIIALPNFKLANDNQVWGLLSSGFALHSNQISSFLKQWKAANQTITAVQKITKAVLAFQNDNLDAMTLFQIGQPLLMDAIQVAQALEIPVDSERVLSQYEQLPIKNGHELAINGGVLIKAGILKPGPDLGRILKQLQAVVINGELPNDQPTLLQHAKVLLQA
ncbi:CCA tRNA nucleotidyltransferase [Lactobacillus sp. Sy-1]|uniref:CCA tRNA nucleotidyltransferase n=1 Tax=Lactobacillus sp. Sy-1 TaxID=2109645 RepID=UPI001C58F3AB|nr:CCA tRNA nucleotidyltransferase [Lactobacillus sp. Sy-1]MBW1605554.1 CCA tRNA nucleotidyltransferase [Lactobacillus sp. Sy-1]